jgi:hypothetical protein
VAREKIGRRLAAILSADVVGYSRLMGIDETGTLGALPEQDCPNYRFQVTMYEFATHRKSEIWHPR